MSPNGTPTPPRNLRRGDRVTIQLRPGGHRITGMVRSNEKGMLSLDDVNQAAWHVNRYPLTIIRHAIKH